MTVSKRSIRDFDLMEKMAPSLRAVVYEFGFETVNACRQAGVTDPARIRQLIVEVWEGARQPSQRKTSGRESRVCNKLDWLLLQAGAEISAEGLLRLLRLNNFVLVPFDPSPQMVEASMDAVKFMGTVSKSEKHRRRLKAAHQAAINHLWPSLAEGRE